MLSLALFSAVVASAAAQSLSCPTAPANENAYSVRSDGNINVGFYACVHDAVAIGQIVFNDHSRADGIVWTNGGVDVDYHVCLGDEELVREGGFAYIWASDADTIIYSPNLVTGAPFVCVLSTAIQSCDTATVGGGLNCASKVTGAVASTTTALDDIIFYERYETQFVHDAFGNSKAVQVPVPYKIGDKFTFRDVTIGRRAVVYFETGRTYYPRNIHVEEDAVIVLADDSGKDYSFYVETSFEMDERVKIVPKDDNRLTIYQNGDVGYVYINNAPANRDHVLNVDIISRALAINGGYVMIGLRQFIHGMIIARSDVIIGNFAEIGHRCYGADVTDVEAAAAARYARYSTYLAANYAKVNAAAAPAAPAKSAHHKSHKLSHPKLQKAL